MTDGLRKSHLRKAPQVGLSEVGLPDIYLRALELVNLASILNSPFPFPLRKKLSWVLNIEREKDVRKKNPNEP